MTDRFNSLTVVLEHDIREDDALAIISAIKHIRGVLSVSGNVSDITTHVACERAKHELGERILDVVYPKRAGQ